MPRRSRFTSDEKPTDPELRKPTPAATHASGRAPKSRRERAEAPTLPPPKSTPKGHKPRKTERSIPKARPKPAPERRGKGAAVDEVVADMSRDPRRDED